MITGMSARHKTDQPLISAVGPALGRFARLVWSYRVELGFALLAMGWFIAGTLLPLYVMTPLWMAVVGILYWQRERIFNALREWLRGARIRRQLERAVRDCGFGSIEVEKVRSTLPGEWVDVRVPRGQTVGALERQDKAIAGCLRVSDVRVVHDREDRSRAGLSIIRRNPFLAMSEMEWPLLSAESVDVRQGIPFGLDEYGRVLQLDLLFRNLIMGGAPNAGKSTSLRIPIAAAVLDPTAKVWMMDAKTGGAEFIHWTPAAERVILGRDLEGAVEMLAKLEERVEKRGQEIVARGEVAVTPDMEIDFLFIDELPQFMRVFETDGKAEAAWVKTIREHIWRLIALGRWAGMITVLSAQKPTADIVPTESRDLIDLKFALHCNTKAMSDAILGAGSGEESPANAADIPTGQHGVGYFVGDEGAQKIRTFFISPKQAAELAERVASRNFDDELKTLA
jgi:S-DNA-T family DNA segregation ATPase FtsK/SpoIIIE